MNFQGILEACLHKVKQAKASVIYHSGGGAARKTTLAKELANRLISEGKKAAIIDADLGPSSRFPLTPSLNYANRQCDDFAKLLLAD